KSAAIEWRFHLGAFARTRGRKPRRWGLRGAEFLLLCRHRSRSGAIAQTAATARPHRHETTRGGALQRPCPSALSASRLALRYAARAPGGIRFRHGASEPELSR